LPDPAAPDDRRGKIDRVRLKVLKQALTPKQQELIKMRYDDRLNFVRIGQRLGIDSTVAWMRNKAAIRKMRAAAKERGWEIYGLLDR
jgi:DNA-directed RNA polymerase specialized sigma subunit